MAASLNLLPWFETARIAAKCTQAAPAMARLLTMRPSVLERDTHPERDSVPRRNSQVRPGTCAARSGIGSAVVDLIRSMAKREVTFLSGTEAIRRL